MICVILESPYAGNTDTNVKYARRCMIDSLNNGEAPFLSHLLYTQCLDDTIPSQRKMGTEAGWEWIKNSDKTVVYQDYGISPGMAEGIKRAKSMGKTIEYRTIGKNN